MLFGATGDLAKRKLFPALYHLERRGELTVPVIGVARSDWTDDVFRKQATAAIEASVAERRRSRCCKRLVQAPRPGPGRLRRPDDVGGADATSLDRHHSKTAVFYMAIPPTMFPTVAESLASVGLNERGRIVVEKPFGRDLRSAHELNVVLHKVFPEEHIFRIDHYLGKESRRGPARVPLLQHAARAGVEPALRAQRADHDVGDDRRRGPRLASTTRSERSATCSRTTCCRSSSLLAMEPPVGHEASYLQDEKVKVFAATKPLDCSTLVRGQYDGYRERARCRRRLDDRDVRRRQAARSTRGAGPGCRGTSASARRWRRRPPRR